MQPQHDSSFYFSDILQGVLSLCVLQPVRRPTGLDTRPLSQQSIVLAQFRVTLFRQPGEIKWKVEKKLKKLLIKKKSMMGSSLVCLTDPNLKRVPIVGKTTTSASVNDFPARLEPEPI